MERLTKRNKYNGAYYPYCFKEDGCCGLGASEKCDKCDFAQSVCEKLAKYEDLEEQGRLIKLPCKVGDMVYRTNKGAKYPIIPLVVTEIRHKALRSGKIAVKIICSDDLMIRTNGCLVYYLEEIGKKIWLTKEEAEKALERMKGE